MGGSGNPVTKAVIPAAGLGTRLRPITHLIPKELLPVGPKPMIQYALEEALAGGIEEACVVINPQKGLIREYLSKKNRELQKVLSSLRITFIEQPQPRGLAEAIWRAKGFVGGENFALLLPDNICFMNQNPIEVLRGVYQSQHCDVTGLMWVYSPEDARGFGNCGRADLEKIENGLFRITKINNKERGNFQLKGKKPERRTLARSIFGPHIFEYIERLLETRIGELDDVPVLQAMLKDRPMVGKLMDGKVFDVGNLTGYLQAQAYYLKKYVNSAF